MIPAEIIEQIREAADMVQLIGESVELKRTGADWRGPCPFHGGSHRNFSVVPKKQMYHCFVCHESGDIFTYFMKRFGLAYPDAVREIAGRVGIEVPEARAQQGPDPNEPLYSALGVAADWFARRLVEADDAKIARDYLASRDISEQVRDDFRLGYAPRGDVMLQAMKSLGITDDVLAGAGLTVTRDDGTVLPRFRGRLIFPIADVRGRIVAFGGRILGEGEPKYLNSPESAVYHKGALLYGLDRARGAIRTDGLAILVEGYVDCIRLQAAGITNVVAPLGTSLTGEQAKVLRRYTKHVAIAYDADQPGLKSTFRAADELLRQGLTVSVVTLPEGEDPDTLVAKQGAAPFRALLAEAVDVLERKLQLLERRGMLSTLEGRRQALDKLLPTMRSASDGITRQLYIQRAAEKTGVPAEAIMRDLDVTPSASQVFDSIDRNEINEQNLILSAKNRALSPERDLVQLMIWSEDWVDRIRSAVPIESYVETPFKQMAQQLYAGSREPDEVVARLWEYLAEPPGPAFDTEDMYLTAVSNMHARIVRARAEELQRMAQVAVGDDQERLLRELQTLLNSEPRRQSSKIFRRGSKTP
jgi:DNA primase